MGDQIYNVINITDNSWRIEENMVRAYLFAGTRHALLIDTGAAGGDLHGVVKSLTDLPVMLVNTHADGDHCGANAQFNEAYLHPAEFTYYYENRESPPAKPLWDGDIIDLGGRSFEVILIPGHTNGSIALLDRENRILVSGDSVSNSPVFMFGEKRSINAFIESMKRLRTYEDAFDTVYPSHGPFPVDKAAVSQLQSAAEKLLRGELEAQQPPMPVPAKLYMDGSVGFFYADD